MEEKLERFWIFQKSSKWSVFQAKTRANSDRCNDKQWQMNTEWKDATENYAPVKDK